MKLIIDIDEVYLECIKYCIKSGQDYKPFEIIANGIPFDNISESEIQEVLNKRCMTAVTNEYLIALHNAHKSYFGFTNKKACINCEYYEHGQCYGQKNAPKVNDYDVCKDWKKGGDVHV